MFETEPPALDNPLLHMDNVIGTPHGLGHADESLRRCAAMTEANVLALIDGRLPPYIVNPRVQWRDTSAGLSDQPDGEQQPIRTPARPPLPQSSCR